MKAQLYIIPAILVLHLCLPSIVKAKDVSDDDKFAGWTDEQFQQYEDSLIAALYPQPTIGYTDSLQQGEDSKKSRQRVAMASNVPDIGIVDQSRAVGEIPIMSGASPTGAKTYEVPIDVFPGINEFQPQLSLAYNSQQGNSELGMGWSLSGLATITRINHSIYFDGNTQSVRMDNSDCFVIDGTRLISIETTGDYILYESEQGNIKVKGYTSGNVMKYFEVFYPDGNRGVFGYANSSQNALDYPITSIVDLNGNEIKYEYVFSGNQYYITQISYNGASVDFQYEDGRPDEIITYKHGLKIHKTKLLSQISCSRNGITGGAYELKYTTINNKSQLTQIDYGVEGSYYNPIRFYYGNGVEDGYNKSETNLIEWYESQSRGDIRALKGKFDYFSGADGVISLPNLNPYWQHYRHSTAFRHSESRFDNLYTGEEKIFLYTGLTDDLAYPMPNLYTEEGFIDILCADIDGIQEEYIIKINNVVVDNLDQVTFKVYKSHVYTGLTLLYTRTYSFPTVYKDAKGAKSVHPKYYYVGDFDGDGKMEIMAMSIHEPFGYDTKPSQCYVFDLRNDKILYEGHLLPYYVELVGVINTDPKVATNNTDKLFVMDYDGDGKSDLCHINDSGLNIYTFKPVDNQLIPEHVSTYTQLDKNGLSDRELLFGDFNGDGLVDIFVSPIKGNKSSVYYDQYNIYNSCGDGTFALSKGSCTPYGNEDNNGLIVQDVNGDGLADLLRIRYDAGDFTTYINQNNAFRSWSSLITSCKAKEPVIVPADVSTRNTFTQLISLKSGKAVKMSFSRDDNQEAMVSGMINSFGIVEKNEYALLTSERDEEDFYRDESNASYPYVNIREPLAVLSSSVTLMNGEQIKSQRYSYYNAVMHKHGRGFCGFERITCMDELGNETVQEYDPFNFSVLKKETSRDYERTYDYSIEVQPSKIARITLSALEEIDMRKGNTVTTDYVYDSYGYPTQERKVYPDNITITKDNVYASNTTVGAGYNLGYMTKQTITHTRNGDTYTEQMHIVLHDKRRPKEVKYSKDGNQVKHLKHVYDSHGNTTSTSVQLYSSSVEQDTTWTYDSYGQVVSRTDPMGLTHSYTYDVLGRLSTVTDYRGGVTTYTYDAFGREVSVTYPDNTSKETEYIWLEDSDGNLYYVLMYTQTGKPYTNKTYDVLNRLTNTYEDRSGNSWSYTENEYDVWGNLTRESLPTSGESIWRTYQYDEFDRVISLTEPSGRETTYDYNGNTVTTTVNGIANTRKYDALGNLLSITDMAGTVSYVLAADGQPVSVTAPGGITTAFEYDQYRRRTAVDDPSAGRTTYEYDAAGDMVFETKANGKYIQYVYDDFHRLIYKDDNDGNSTTYEYNEYNDLMSVYTGRAYKDMVYDEFGRLTTSVELDAYYGYYLQKDYSYADGNISAITYSTHNGELVTENYIYSNGCLSEGRINNSTTVFKLEKEHNLGMPSKITTGDITRIYEYTDDGLPMVRKAYNSTTVFQDFHYEFDGLSHNLQSRTDNTRGLTEQFAYDDLDRLVEFSGHSVNYEANGNISDKSDVGAYGYDEPEKPYAVTSVDFYGSGVSRTSQVIDYMASGRPAYLYDDDVSIMWDYNGDDERFHCEVQEMYNPKTIHYFGGCYEMEESSNGTLEKLYLFGDYYKAAAVYVKHSDSEYQEGVYNILRDYLGSITHVISPDNTLIQELSYDAWGRLRDPETQEVYDSGDEPELFLGRGYTGHEHVHNTGLINMNARLYDPVLGRFLSPDPEVQEPENSQNFNRYSYVLNNPLKYNDLNGELFGLTIFTAITDVIWNIVTHFTNFSHWDMKRTVNAWKIDMGMFKGNLVQVLNKWTLGFTTSLIGNLTAHWCNLVGKVDGVTNLNGMLALSGALSGDKGMTIGHYSLGPKNYRADWRDHLFVHEYGHYIQSQYLGPLFIPVIGKSSLLSTIFTSKLSGMEHHERWFETDASKRGAKYFDKRYGRGKAGYDPGSDEYFDINAFVSGSTSEYTNPRTQRKKNAPRPIHKKKVVWWDFVL